MFLLIYSLLQVYNPLGKSGCLCMESHSLSKLLEIESPVLMGMSFYQHFFTLCQFFLVKKKNSPLFFLVEGCRLVQPKCYNNNIINTMCSAILFMKPCLAFA